MGQILFAPAGAGVTSDDVTATKAQVLSGYTALTSDSDDEAASGSMTNNGAWTSSSSGSGKITIPAGYHNGSGYVDCSGAYNKGVTDADNRTNSNSANYKAGYNAGYNAGRSSISSVKVVNSYVEDVYREDRSSGSISYNASAGLYLFIGKSHNINGHRCYGFSSSGTTLFAYPNSNGSGKMNGTIYCAYKYISSATTIYISCSGGQYTGFNLYIVKCG